MAEKVAPPPIPRPAATKAAPSTEAAAPEEKPKKQRTKWQEVYPTPEAAVEEAQNREKGPRKAFTVTLNGRVTHCVANNEGRAMGVAAALAGATCEEIGKQARKPKPLGLPAILASVSSLPQDEQAAVMAQLKALLGK